MEDKKPTHKANMTTLELARKIADEVEFCVRLGPPRSPDNIEDRATQAVLRVLHETDSWFCRLSEDEQGVTVDTKYEPAAKEVQPPLFGE